MRTRFKLPYGLHSSVLDIAVSISSENGLRMKRPVTIRVVFIAILGFFGYLLLATQTPLFSGNIVSIILWTTGWWWLVYLLCVPTLTKEVGMNMVAPMLRYAQPVNRTVLSRTSSLSMPVRNMVGMDGITPDKDLIVFSNNDIGRVYEVVGNASILMFDEDTAAVLKSAQNFYRKVSPKVSLMLDSATESQRVHNQVHAMEKREQNLMVKSKGLQSLVQSHQHVLKNYVGNDFKSLHQYMVVRATDVDALEDFHNWMQIQIDKDSGFLKSFRLLNSEESFDYLHEIYTRPEFPNSN